MSADLRSADVSGPELLHRVVIVDDDPDYRYLLRLALDTDGGYEVVGEAGDGADALEIVRRELPDLVLLEVDPPDGAGLDLLPVVREAAPDAVPVLVSALPPGELMLGRQEALPIAHLSKRTRLTVLPSELRALAAMVELVSGAIESTRTELPNDLLSPRRARRFADEALQRWDCGELVDTVSLLLSELVSNAVMHAESPSEVVVRLHEDRLRIEVADRNATIPHRRPPDDRSPSGRGIALVEKLADAWGLELEAGGKRIWFEVRRPEPRREDGTR
jgi:DNA-binding NarL/FixJ family response regulator